MDYSEIKIRLKIVPDGPAPNYEADYNKPPTMSTLVAMPELNGPAAKLSGNPRQFGEKWNSGGAAAFLPSRA
jgi:hypothetical protein